MSGVQPMHPHQAFEFNGPLLDSDCPPPPVPPKKNRNNNPYGARGTWKCRNCRKRKQKCVFPDGNVHTRCDACVRQNLPCSEKVLASQTPDSTVTSTPLLAPSGYHRSTPQASSSAPPRTVEPSRPRADWPSTLSGLDVVQIRSLVDLLQSNRPLPRSVQVINYPEIVRQIAADSTYENNPHLQWAHSTREYSNRVARATGGQWPSEPRSQQLEVEIPQHQVLEQIELADPGVPPHAAAFWMQAPGPSHAPSRQETGGTQNTPVHDHTMQRLVENTDGPYPSEDIAGAIFIRGRGGESGSGRIGTNIVEEDPDVGVAESQVERAEDEEPWSDYQGWLQGK